MLPTLRTLLLLWVLCAGRSGAQCLRFSRARSDVLLCGDQRAHDPLLSGGDGGVRGSPDYSARESRDRRSPPGGGGLPPNYRLLLSQTRLRGKTLQGGGARSGARSGDRRSKFTLSLDVPTNIMNILFDMAKAKKLRAKAADNARLLAHIGRRK
ncbi:hypothetical protein NHX12_020922 [Muraenolepis orangiensis]|uniref:Corticotropin-releasing factor domain-containing protein n=1 Tax=Muraenolepis orangiensis TaxID=630683 RepID=A0A9Q0IX24_9TELE|nr:hypothetical protein NHX12_020922 [Muraenolepis orangiensis]